MTRRNLACVRTDVSRRRGSPRQGWRCRGVLLVPLCTALMGGGCHYGDDNFYCGEAATTRGGLALTFDDQHLDDWVAALPLLQRHSAHATFFITRVHGLDDGGWAKIAALAAAGNEIAAHTADHVRASDYCGSNSTCAPEDVQAYVAEQIEPELADFAAHGYQVTDFAFPGGSDPPPVERALEAYFHRIRAITGSRGHRFAYHGEPFVRIHESGREIGAVGIDQTDARGDGDFIDGLERAQCEDETFVVYGHDIVAAPGAPGTTYQRLELLLDTATELGLTVRRVNEL